MFINNGQFAYSDEYDLDRLAKRFYERQETYRYFTITTKLNDVHKSITTLDNSITDLGIYIDKVTDTVKILRFKHGTKEVAKEMIVEHADEVTDELINELRRY